MHFIELILIALACYLLVGFGFAWAFVIKGVRAIDEVASSGSLGFRLIIFPASMMLWPILLRKWRRA